MSIAGIFALGSGYEDSDSNYSFGGYYGSRGRGRFGAYNGYNDGRERCCRDDDDDDGLLSFLLD
ncbi:MAG: hypothetical protein ACRDS9_03740 [Pseudonocardiaceae bacterium]